MDVFFDLITAITQGPFGLIVMLGITIACTLAINREPNKMPLLLFPIGFGWQYIGIGAGSIYVTALMWVFGILFAAHIVYNSQELVQRIVFKPASIAGTAASYAISDTKSFMKERAKETEKKAKGFGTVKEQVKGFIGGSAFKQRKTMNRKWGDL